MSNQKNLDEYFEQLKQVESSGNGHENNKGYDAHDAEESALLDEDASTFRYFVSEPSVSETDGAESLHRERILSLLSPVGDLADPPPQPPETSPGNTSLSSKDSSQLGFRNLVHVQFTPEQRSRLRLPGALDDSLHHQLESLPPPLTADIPKVDDSRKQEVSGSNPKRNRGSLAAHLERNLQRSSSDETDKIDNSLASIAQGDETLIMTLSESDEDEVETKDTENTPLDWEQKHSADDEQTSSLHRRRRWFSLIGKAARGHRRTRSGDAAAASLMTGGSGWKGMQMDKLPIPPAPEEHDDEDEDTIDHERPIDRKPFRARKGREITKAREGAPCVDKARIEDAANVDQREVRVGSDISGNNPAGKRWARQDQGRERKQSPREGLELQQSASVMTPDTFSHFALQPRTSAEGQSRHGDFLPTIDYRPPSNLGEYVNFPETRHSSGGVLEYAVTGYGRGHGRRPSDTSISTRDSAFSWLSNSDRLSSGVGVALYNTNRSGRKQGESPTSERSTNNVDEDSGSYYSSDTEEDRDIMHNKMQYQAGSVRGLQKAERLLESRSFRGNAQNVMRPQKMSPFANVGKAASKASLSSFTIANGACENYPTFVCPKCKTVQREFFTVASAPSQFESPAGYLALYFGIYVIAALYIFGLEEGWAPLDCVYFAVITLTTAGLGDLVPTSDGAKIICSIFIYFGVACIGLLLGTYLASMMDDKSTQEARKNRVENCTNCARMKDLNSISESRNTVNGSSREHFATRATKLSSFGSKRWISERPLEFHQDPPPAAAVSTDRERKGSHSRSFSGASGSMSEHSNTPRASLDVDVRTPNLQEDRKNYSGEKELEVIDSFRPGPESSPGSSAVLGSPMTTQILGRQRRTRHMSIGKGESNNFFGMRGRKYSDDVKKSTASPAIPEGKPYGATMRDNWHDDSQSSHTGEESGDESSIDSSESSSLDELKAIRVAGTRQQTAKYIFLTLKQALMNSLLIIAIGGVGFRTIEKMTIVDSFYFTTVLLTTVGYGDIHPVTSAGKLFATIYVLVAGTVLLNNMSLISMIPLELRKRRLEQVVLTQFGDQLDDLALRELATGPLVRRLQLDHKPSTTGLDECTREMFALAMLVRLGKVSESDIRMTFGAFRSLDVDNDGVLSSKSIIAGMMAAKRRAIQQTSRSAMTEVTAPSVNLPPPPPPYGSSPFVHDYWYGDRVVQNQGEPPYDDQQAMSRLSSSLSPQLQIHPSEQTALYGSAQDYDSFAHEIQHGYSDDEGRNERLSRSLV